MSKRSRRRSPKRRKSSVGPVRVFIAYSHRDTALVEQFTTHLAVLRGEGLIEEWSDHKIAPGDDWDRSIAEQLAGAGLILLMVSADFLASEYCSGVEMRGALERESRGDVRVVPVILRHCDWTSTPLARLQAVPARGTPVASSPDQDRALTEAVQAIRRIVDTTRRAELRGTVMPNYPDAETRRLSLELAAARQRQLALREANADTALVDTEILELRRKLREGGVLRPGDSLEDGRYLLLARLGRGGFGVVWEARDRDSGEHVAVKVLHGEYAGETHSRERFFRGARVMASLDHPAIVRIINPRGEDGGHSYFVMELLGGGDLQAAAKRQALTEDQILEITLKIGNALSFAHARAYFHRDIKPANILLDGAGNAKLTDFDLVSAGDSTGGTRTGAMGTFAYVAPEVADKPQNANASSDTYSLAMTAISALLGGLSLQDVYGRSVASRLKCATRVELVLRKAIAFSPADRYADAAAFCNALERARSFDFRGSELAGSSLVGAKLSQRDYSDSNFADADLSNAVLRGATLARCDLSRAILAGADLTDADLSDANMSGANLTNAKLDGANLTRANLRKAKVDAAQLQACSKRDGLLGPEAPMLWQPDIGRGACLCLVFEPVHARVLVTGHMDGFIRLWNLRSADQVASFRASAAAVWQVALDDTGRRLASVSWDGYVRVWHFDAPLGSVVAPEGPRAQELEYDQQVLGEGAWSTAFCPAGEFLASGSNDNMVRIWAVRDGRMVAELRGHRGPVRSVAFSRAGKWLASGSDDDTVRVWDWLAQRTVHTLHVARPIGSLHAENDTADEEPMPYSARSVVLAEADGFKRLLVRKQYSVRSLQFSRDGKLLVAAWDDGVIRAFDATTGLLLTSFEGHTDWVRAVALTADAEQAVSASDDRTLRIWDRQGRCRVSQQLDDGVLSAALSAAEPIIACGLNSGVIELRQLTDAGLLKTLGKTPTNSGAPRRH